jgi:hypothetical protein
MMLRRFFFTITSASLLAIACGGSADSTGTSTQSDSACSVVATSYDQSCSKDADCVLVPPGGNTCDPCGGDPSGSGMYYFFCDEVAINVKDRARYLAALQSGLATVPDKQLSCSSSCPMAPAATCVQGTCTPSQALGTP